MSLESYLISAHKYMKITLHQVYIFLQKIDVLSLSETYLKSTISFDDGSLEIPGYN